MQYWLFKSEPYKWSWDQQKQAGHAGTEWDGVRNYQARNFMRQMQLGDRGFFYHSNEGKEIVGIVEVSATAHPDSTTDDARWECVDLRAIADVARPVSLSQVKETPELSDMVLVTSMRLSVQPVKLNEWRIVCTMLGIDPESLKSV